jgi:CheY-like chemotaxis protein
MNGSEVVETGRPEIPDPTVLVVEDDADVRGFMALLLEHGGYQVMTATNGLEALIAMRRTCPDLVLLDLAMPVMDGYEFRRQQLRDAALCRVPVVCITAAYDPETVALQLNVPCVRKPIDIDLVMEHVAHACGH